MDLKNYTETYVNLLVKCGFILEAEKHNILKELNNFNLVVDNKLKLPYYYDNKNTTYINDDLCSNFESWNIDEFIFEGFTSYLNSFHKSLFVKDKISINKLMRSYISKDLYDTFYKVDPFINGLNLQNGLFMMDKFVSQFVSQRLVEKKYSNSDYENEIKEKYSIKTFTYNSSEPNVILKTKFNNNHLIYSFALKIINDYFNGDTFNFVKRSFSKDFVRSIISNFSGSVNLANFYKDLCYLGVIEKNHLYDNGFTNNNLDDDDPSLDPENLFLIIKKLLGSNFFIASELDGKKNNNTM